VVFEAKVAGEPPIEGDETQMMQLFTNLLVNARQAVAAGGGIRATAGPRTLGKDEIDQLAAGDYVQIEVADDGAGIPERLLAKIFDPFFTTKLEGSGLGLAICFAIVQGHGGHISAASQPGAGSRFTILLPAAPAERRDRLPADEGPAEEAPRGMAANGERRRSLERPRPRG